MIVLMVGAIAKVHWQHGFFINWGLEPGKGHGLEANLAFIAMALACRSILAFCNSPLMSSVERPYRHSACT